MHHLREAHPEVAFSIIMGQDNLESFHTWKDHEPWCRRTDVDLSPLTRGRRLHAARPNGWRTPTWSPRSAHHRHQLNVRAGRDHGGPRRAVPVARRRGGVHRQQPFLRRRRGLKGLTGRCSVHRPCQARGGDVEHGIPALVKRSSMRSCSSALHLPRT